jgi:hypothetical protein
MTRIRTALNPNKVGTATDNLFTYSSQNKSTYNGFEVSANLRRDKFLLFGGVTTDRLVTSSCDGSTTLDVGARGASARDNPNSLRFCDVVLATSGQPAGVFRTTVKASATYSFPYDIQVSGSFASIPGPGVRADFTVTSALAGRPIIGSTTGAASTVVNLVEPNSLFLDTQKRLDLRAGKTFRFNRYRVQGFVDVFNALNAGTVLSINQTYGRQQSRDKRMVHASDDHGRPLYSLRRADVVLVASGRGEGSGVRLAAAQFLPPHRPNLT